MVIVSFLNFVEVRQKEMGKQRLPSLLSFKFSRFPLAYLSMLCTVILFHNPVVNGIRAFSLYFGSKYHKIQIPKHVSSSIFEEEIVS